MIVQSAELVCQRQIVVVGSKICHHEATSVSRAARSCVADVMGITCGNVRMLNTQVIDAARHCQAVSF